MSISIEIERAPCGKVHRKGPYIYRVSWLWKTYNRETARIENWPHDVHEEGAFVNSTHFHTNTQETEQAIDGRI